MAGGIPRRTFVKAAAATTFGAPLVRAAQGGAASAGKRAVRIGLVGAGGRGTALLEILLGMDAVGVPAVCDIDAAHLARAREKVAKSGRPEPEGYGEGPEAYEGLVAREDLDAVIIATPWQWHAPMAVCGLRAGKYVGVEVPAAITVEGCWDLVRASEETGLPCMMLENWSFRRDNLAVLKMIREGLLGEIVHGHCAHSHNCIDHWFFDREGNARWPAEFLVTRNADQYPTHSLGPVLSWMDIPCGDTFDYLTSTATRSIGINHYFAKRFGPDHPAAKRRYKQGDIVTTVVRTKKGRTIVINYDMQLPRPYDNRWLIQGTEGIYNEQRAAVYLHGRSPEYEEWEPFAPYQERYDHAWWKGLEEEIRAKGHGGTDVLELRLFVEAVRERRPTPIDVYESVLMSAIVGLSEQSIAQASAPVECPDFTGGAWRTRRPAFAVEA